MMANGHPPVVDLQEVPLVGLVVLLVDLDLVEGRTLVVLEERTLVDLGVVGHTLVDLGAVGHTLVDLGVVGHTLVEQVEVVDHTLPDLGVEPVHPLGNLQPDNLLLVVEGLQIHLRVLGFLCYSKYFTTVCVTYIK